MEGSLTPPRDGELRPPVAPAATVRAFCAQILRRGDLASKLRAPVGPEGAPLVDAPGPPAIIDAPTRAPELALARGAPRLPRPGELTRPDARARCLARFAHHELMAVELFAWALLRWTDLPGGLRRGFLRILAEEQEHCRLYLARLAAHGSCLAEHELSGYFWRHVPAIAASPFGPRAFLCAMGLTYEQANLDFAGLYGEAFRAAGDEASARVCERVHAEEVGHVRLAAVWNRRLAPPGRSDLEAYREAVPFPLSPARAKGRRFDAASRQRAGLSAAFVEHVRTARSQAKPAPREE